MAMVVNCSSSNLPIWLQIPINKIASIADHTYVECTNSRKSWSCHGRNSGGSVISFGDGCDLSADCLYGNDEAGIDYLVTGVCHQIANRTLASAKITVDKAKCYILSSATYGEYGLYHANWHFRKRQCNISNITENKREFVYQALISKRAALQKHSINENEIDQLFKIQSASLKNKLKKTTLDWKIEFLDYAISYVLFNKFEDFYNQLHSGLNNYSNNCANIIGYDHMARLLQLDNYSQNDYILLCSPENQS